SSGIIRARAAKLMESLRGPLFLRTPLEGTGCDFGVGPCGAPFVCNTKTMRLKNIVPFHADETTAPFVSRLAFANGVPTIADLLMDAELTMTQFLKADPKAFTMLSGLSGVAVHDL
ncbi:MAG: hypothetical protein ACPG4X_22525, partial [Pikeienuella sp.]